MTLIHHARWLIIPCLALLSTIDTANAQDALGGGNVLDNRVVTRGRGNPGTPSNRLDLRSRNLVVTGNVVGGRGFRDSVGYTAANDFRGDVGSDDLFDFRARSALSNPLASTGTRHLGRSLGASLGMLEYHRTAEGRGAFSLVTGDRQPRTYTAGADTQLRVDRETSRMADELDRRSTATAVGAVRRGDNQTFVVESLPLRGITAVDSNELQLVTGMPTMDRLRVMDDIASGLTQAADIRTPYQTRLADDTPPGERVDDQPDAARMETLDQTGYNEMLARIRGRYDSDGEIEDTYGSLRTQLRGEQPAADDAEQTRTSQAPPKTIENQRPRPGQTDPGAADPDELEETDQRIQPLTDEQKQRLRELTNALRHGSMIETLSQRDADRFSELMQQAEQQLKDGDFFWAERRFNRALQIRPGHPLASAGLGHAQLGAGLLLPAALTLENMLRDHPEMIDANYATGLFPDDQRLTVVLNTIDRRVQAEADVRPFGFLQAYVGHLRDDRSMIELGLKIMREAAGEAVEDDVMLSILEATWLAEDDAQKAGSENAGDGGASGD